MRAWQIVKKDLKLLFRDRRALATLVVLPLIFITVIGLTTGQLLGWSDRNKVLSIVMVDQTSPEKLDEQVRDLQLPERDTKLIRARNKNLVTKIYNTLQSREGVDVYQDILTTPEAARELFHSGKVGAAMIIGPEFFDRVRDLTARDILAIKDGRLSEGLKSLDITLESDNPETSTHSIVEQFIFTDTIMNVVPCPICAWPPSRLQVKQSCEAFEAGADADPIPRDKQKAHAAPNNAVYQQVIPGMTVMFVFFLVNIMAQSFIQERSLGTLRRLRIAPLGSTSLLTGKVIPFFIISLAQTLLLFGFGKFAFGMNWGNEPWLLLPVIFCTSIAATALGLLVATLVRTESQVSAYANLVVVGLAGISGCFMPREWLPSMMKEISLYTPHAWALLAYEQLLQKAQPNVGIVIESCAMLFGFGVLFFCVGCLRFGKVE